MALGPGKYDHLATYARKTVKAEGVVVFVVGGEHGSGFSVQGSYHLNMMLPDMLRNVANQIEDSMRQAGVEPIPAIEPPSES